MGRVLPQLVGLGAQARLLDVAGQLAHGHRRRQRTQRAETDPLDGRADVGDFLAAAVVGGRVGDGDGARGQQRLGLHQARGLVDMAVGIAQRALQLERRVDMRGKAEFAAPGLRGNALEGVDSVHQKIILPTDIAAA